MKLKSGVRDADREFKHVEQSAKRTVTKVNSDLSSLGAGLKIDRSGLTSTLGTLGDISSIIRGLPTLASGAGMVLSPFKDLAKLGLEFNRVEENAKIAFGVILKDGAKAKKLYEELREVGRISPIFDTSGLIGYSQLFLEKLGPGKELLDSLKGIGAMVAKTGHLENMPSVMKAMKQILDRPTATAEESP